MIEYNRLVGSYGAHRIEQPSSHPRMGLSLGEVIGIAGQQASNQQLNAQCFGGFGQN